MNEKTRVQVWDFPTRLFHWSLVLSFAGLWYTGEQGDMTNHFRLGYTVLGLLLFRFGWGFWGGRFSRFSSLKLSPRASLAYLRQGMTEDKPGHNPLGSWGVVVILVSLSVQVCTGLFATDDMFVEGPLASFAPSSVTEWMTGLHHDTFDFLLWVIGFHVAAVLFHSLWHKQDLIPGMLTGWRRVHGQHPVAPMKTPWLAGLVIAALAALAALVVSSFG
ncbi:MAG: cytochrome b/b6 domain-containing protein [Kistimonas sp.]|nr:cytochrome b/b6 domain-containing protein [Kistimonas sp.]